MKQPRKKKKVDVKLANFLGGVDLFAEDEDEDMDDGLFSRKNRKMPVIPNPNLNQNQNNNIIMQNQQPQMIQNQQPQMIQMPQINPLINLNNNLGNAKKKLKNMFGDSDDDDDDENPLNVDAKKEEKKIENNNIFQEDAKKVEVVEKKEDIQIKEEKIYQFVLRISKTSSHHRNLPINI